MKALLKINRSRIPILGLYIGFVPFTIANMYRFCKSYVDLPDSSHEDECEHCKAERLEREKDHQKSN